MPTAPDEKRAFRLTPSGLVLCVFLAVAALFLVLEHRAHLLGAWPLIFLLACPIMHFFMHRGHGGHGSQARPHHSDQTERRSDHGQ